MDIKIQMEATIEITDCDIDDIMATALDGGVNYWCDEVRVDRKIPNIYTSDYISRGGKLWFFLSEPFDDHNTEWYMLDKVKFMRGLRKFLKNPANLCCYLQPTANGTWGLDVASIDAACADEIIQYALFREVVFG